MPYETRLLPLSIIFLGRASFLGRGMARRGLLQLLDHLDTKCVRTTYSGVPFMFHLDNPTERRALFGRYDDRELNFLLEPMEQPDSVFIDIGANSGFYTNNILAKSNDAAKVVAIEPNPAMVERLLANAALLDKKIEADTRLIVVQKALSENEGEAFLNLATGHGSAHLTDQVTSQTLRVATVSLTDLLLQYNITRIDALKIDVEGHEDRVLNPFLDQAPKSLWPQRIVIEHTSQGEWHSDILARLLASGYQSIQITRGNALLARKNG